METKKTDLYDKEGNIVATVELPGLRQERFYVVYPVIVLYQGRYFAADGETGDYNEGDFYEVPS